ncbi:phage shock protein A (PspA) family protein [Azospirillum oryzae]|uniref:Phage shock protein A (PspA) family protein n=1 Tax=Azospirillum oryzae TaxID=286727 RepID=A0A1X7GAL7_9PROT|nr:MULTISPECIES: phage shock protein PspA [Azospirillum]KAA0573822.1 phage shock protein PspA [Azospirillum sp. Sh1]KAA0590620.1 phage shock protein PspA [Azospirillum oryzae]QKS52984.1 phage shock protein PspA [Azospirillum oryzae]SMF66780.1 phage shock protein A (PspA) family protein [Azospirillum oryzae]GLR80067.1 phage shock protein PspA [Azospirillum oryzae]
MSIFSRLTDIVQSNLNSLLDRAEEPEKLIRLIIQEMEDTLVEVRSSTVKIIAEKKEIERRVADLHRERDEWDRKAEVALTRDREDLAKGALMAKSKVAEQADALAEQLVQVEAALSKANEDIGRLQAKLTDAKTREKALVARTQTASNRVKVRTVLHDERINDALSRFEQVERNLDEMEGRVEAYDVGRTKSLTEEIAELEATHKVEEDLAALKARIAARRNG